MFKEKLSERYSWYAQLGRKWRFLEAVKPHTRKNKQVRQEKGFQVSSVAPTLRP